MSDYKCVTCGEPSGKYAICWRCLVEDAGGDPSTPEPAAPDERGAVLQELLDRQRDEAQVETERLLVAVGRLMRRFVVLPSGASHLALALFALHTWAFEAAYATPYIVVESPEKQSGKTRLLEVLDLVCRNPLRVASITAAALFQSVEGSEANTVDRRGGRDLCREG